MGQHLATVAGRPLTGWRRQTPEGVWHAREELGALRLAPELLEPPGALDRIVASVLAVARLGLPGVLGTADLVEEEGQVWLLTARPPRPLLAELLGSALPDAGSAATVLNETAQTLLALHAAGLAHGSALAESVTLTPDGTALLLAPGLRADTTPTADAHAWAALARVLRDAWIPEDTPAAALLTRVATTAESSGLPAARDALVAGRAVLPPEFLTRPALRAALAAHPPAPPAPPAPQLPSGEGEGTLPGPPPPAAAEAETGPAASEARVLGARRSAPARARSAAAADAQATVLGQRLRASLSAARSAVGGEEVLLRFGPGVPEGGPEHDALMELWPREKTAAASPPRRRRTGWLVDVGVFLGVAAVLWFLLRPGPGPSVSSVRVQGPAAVVGCDGTADLVGILRTDGKGGPVSYHWFRSDGQDSGTLTQTARSGESSLTVHLRWTVRGSGSFHGTATLEVLSAGRAAAEGGFSYHC